MNPIRRPGLPAALLTISALASPAAAVDKWWGFLCGYTGFRDPTGIVSGDPRTRFGEIDGGPWVVVNESGGAVHNVTITCTIQVNNGSPGGGGVARSSTMSGNVGLLLDTISYQANTGDQAYLCTNVSWNTSKGHTSTDFDVYPMMPGVNCAEITSLP